jgi:hypothetical protein
MYNVYFVGQIEIARDLLEDAIDEAIKIFQIFDSIVMPLHLRECAKESIKIKQNDKVIFDSICR